MFKIMDWGLVIEILHMDNVTVDREFIVIDRLLLAHSISIVFALPFDSP